MPCLCRGTGAIRVCRYYRLMNEFRIVEKDCACRSKFVDFPYEDEAMRGKTGGTKPAFAAQESPLTTSR